MLLGRSRHADATTTGVTTRPSRRRCAAWVREVSPRLRRRRGDLALGSVRGAGLARRRAALVALARRRRWRLAGVVQPAAVLALDPVEQDAREAVLLLEPLGGIRDGLDALDQQ